MKCLDKDNIIAYAEGRIDNPSKLEQIKSHIESCRKCQHLLRTYLVLHRKENEKNDISDELHDVMEHSAEHDEAREVYTSKLARNVRIFGIVFTTLVILGIFCLFLWQTYHRQNPSKILNIAGLNYKILGDNEPIDDFQAQEISSAIIFSDIDDHLGVLTSNLAKALIKKKINNEFWSNLSDILAKQGINMPSSSRILMIENSLYSYIKSGKTPSDNEILVTFYDNSIVIIRCANSSQ